MTNDETATALAEAMRARVAGVEPPPGFLDAVARRRGPVVPLLAGAAAVLAVVAVSAVVAGGERTPAPPAASAPPTPSASATPAARPRFEATWLPPGFVRGISASEPLPLFEDGRQIWTETQRYWRYDERGVIRGMLLVTTSSGDVTPPSMAEYEGTEPDAREVRLRGRTVFHVRNDVPRGLGVYTWLEQPGVVVEVVGRQQVTDAEIRRFLLGVRRVS